jgi:hypothetical protein
MSMMLNFGEDVALVHAALNQFVTVATHSSTSLLMLDTFPNCCVMWRYASFFERGFSRK